MEIRRRSSQKFWVKKRLIYGSQVSIKFPIPLNYLLMAINANVLRNSVFSDLDVNFWHRNDQILNFGPFCGRVFSEDIY